MLDKLSKCLPYTSIMAYTGEQVTNQSSLWKPAFSLFMEVGNEFLPMKLELPYMEIEFPFTENGEYLHALLAIFFSWIYIYIDNSLSLTCDKLIFHWYTSFLQHEQIASHNKRSPQIRTPPSALRCFSLAHVEIAQSDRITVGLHWNRYSLSCYTHVLFIAKQQADP